MAEFLEHENKYKAFVVLTVYIMNQLRLAAAVLHLQQNESQTHATTFHKTNCIVTLCTAITFSKYLKDMLRLQSMFQQTGHLVLFMTLVIFSKC